MALSPASSHGGGLPLTGGTLTDTLTDTPSNTGHVAFAAVPAVGATAAATDTFESYDDTGNLLWFVDAKGNFLLDLSQHGGTTVEIDATSPGQLLYANAGSLTLKLPVGRSFSVFDHLGATVLAAPEAGVVSAPKGGAALSPITSGALPTVAPVSATAFQCSTTRDVFLTVPVTYNPGVATTATCKVELSPDNVTFSELVTITQPVGTVFDGSIEAVQLVVPAGWRVKLTVTNATLGTGTYY